MTKLTAYTIEQDGKTVYTACLDVMEGGDPVVSITIKDPDLEKVLTLVKEAAKFLMRF